MTPKIVLQTISIAFIFLSACEREKKIVEVRYAPVLYDLAAPDSIQRNSPFVYYLFVSAFDPDGYDDIDSVFFRVTRPDSSLNPVAFVMHDDGQLGDSVSLDGRFTLGITAGNDSSQLGEYIFRFSAHDMQGNESNHPETILIQY
jgi:hypothetical protein